MSLHVFIYNKKNVYEVNGYVGMMLTENMCDDDNKPQTK